MKRQTCGWPIAASILETTSVPKQWADAHWVYPLSVFCHGNHLCTGVWRAFSAGKLYTWRVGQLGLLLLHAGHVCWSWQCHWERWDSFVSILVHLILPLSSAAPTGRLQNRLHFHLAHKVSAMCVIGEEWMCVHPCVCMWISGLHLWACTSGELLALIWVWPSLSSMMKSGWWGTTSTYRTSLKIRYVVLFLDHLF